MAAEVLSAGIIVADHVCTPISHLPAEGELVLAEGMLLTIGGCAANVGVDLVKMGVKTTVVGRVGNDTFGRVVTDLLHEAGVDTTGIQVTPGRETSQTLIVNVRGQDRRFIHIFGANADFQADDLRRALKNGCKVLYLGGYLVMPGLKQDDLVPVFAEARDRGVKTVLDVVVPAPGPDYVKQLDRLLPHVDVFLPNNHEGQIITGSRDPLEQAEVFRKLGAKTVVITLGGEGALLATAELRLQAGVFPVNYVDGSGGGDAFDAGFICGLLNGLGPEECLRLASALGASCVRAIGTTPGVFTRKECEEFLAQNSLKIDRV